mgnify:CR=1 FL=1
MKTIAFFNNKGGVGKTTLVYHVAWMCAELGKRVLAADLDAQSNLTAMFLDESALERLWPEEGAHQSILTCISPIVEGLGDIAGAPLQHVRDRISLLPGDLGLSGFEDKLSDAWPRCLDGDKAAFRTITAFHRILQHACDAIQADIVLMDIGPNLGAINRSALIASDFIVMPLAPSLFSVQGLRNLGPTVQAWREQWRHRLAAKPHDLELPMPSGAMRPAGYAIMQHVERKDRPVKAYERWIARIPKVYAESILQDGALAGNADPDANRIGLIKNYQSLMPLAEDARKPIFNLTPADGAIGAHAAAVSKCYLDFKALTLEILRRTGCGLPG